jgi:hypothetical protein
MCPWLLPNIDWLPRRLLPVAQVIAAFNRNLCRTFYSLFLDATQPCPLSPVPCPLSPVPYLLWHRGGPSGQCGWKLWEQHNNAGMAPSSRDWPITQRETAQSFHLRFSSIRHFSFPITYSCRFIPFPVSVSSHHYTFVTISLSPLCSKLFPRNRHE